MSLTVHGDTFVSYGNCNTWSDRRTRLVIIIPGQANPGPSHALSTTLRPGSDPKLARALSAGECAAAWQTITHLAHMYCVLIIAEPIAINFLMSGGGGRWGGPTDSVCR